MQKTVVAECVAKVVVDGSMYVVSVTDEDKCVVQHQRKRMRKVSNCSLSHLFEQQWHLYVVYTKLDLQYQ